MDRRLGSVAIAVGCVAVLAVAAGVGAVGGSPAMGPVELSASGPVSIDDPGAYEGFDPAVAERAVAALVDERRTTTGAGAIAVMDGARSFSRAHSVDMVGRDYLGHSGPNGADLTDRVDDSRVSRHCGSVGENVARVYLDEPFEAGDEVYETTDEETIAEALVAAWLDSPSHRENLLADKWVGQSVGIAVDANGTVYATHHFCER